MLKLKFKLTVDIISEIDKEKCKIVMIKKEYLVKYWMKFNRYISGKKQNQ